MNKRNLLQPTPITIYIAAIIYALGIIIPMYFVFVSAFKENADIFRSPLALPPSLDFTRFEIAQQRVDIVSAIGNSIYISISAEIVTLLFAVPAAYAIARIDVGISRIIELVFAAGLLVPTFALLVPIFLLAADVGLLYEPLYLIVFYGATRLSLAVVVLASAIRDIPIELDESAMIDGATRLLTLMYIIFPLARSGVATVVILNFIEFWNEYLFALVLLPPNFNTVQLALPLLRSERLIDYGLIASGVVMAVVPVYIVFTFFQERIVTNITSGGLKG